MTPQEVFDYFGDGTPAKAARKLGRTRQALYRWRDVGYVPDLWQFKLEVLSHGALKASLPGQT